MKEYIFSVSISEKGNNEKCAHCAAQISNPEEAKDLNRIRIMTDELVRTYEKTF